MTHYVVKKRVLDILNGVRPYKIRNRFNLFEFGFYVSLKSISENPSIFNRHCKRTKVKFN